MPEFEIGLPDGRILDIEAADEAAALRGAQEWFKANPKPDPKKALEDEIRKQDGIGARFGRFSDMVMDPLGVMDEMSGAGAYAGELIASRGDWDKAAQAYTDAAERKRAERRVARDESGWLGTAAELAGGLAMSGPARLAQAAAAAPGALQTAKAAAQAGAMGGAIAGAAQGEGGALERLRSAGEGAIVGGVAGPVISNVLVPGVARAWGAGRDAVGYAQRALAAARDPDRAAVDAVADQLTDAGLDFGRLRAAVQPPTSSALQRRGLSDQDLAEIISRQQAGETAASVGQTYGIGEDTARRYFKAYEAANPTPVNLADLAVEQQGYQGAMPLLRRARANYGIAPDANIASTLESRQLGQPGRVSDMLQTSKATTPEGDQLALEDHIKYLAGEAKKAERAAYAEVRRQKADIDIGGTIREARRRARGRQGEIGREMNKAIDLFFEPELREALQSPMSKLRMTELGEAVDKAAKAGDLDRAEFLQRRLAAMYEQDDFSRPLREAKIGTPIKDVQRFIDARDELSQMVERSKQDGKNTPLTAELTRLRTELNFDARQSNPALTAADARFHDDRTVERLIEEGQKLGASLNPRSREAMREFSTLTPTQQEVVRTAFEQNLANIALNTTDGNAAAKRFQSQGFRELVEAFYPKSAGAEVHKRGQTMLRRLRRESITTNAGNFITNRNNSPTAFLTSDMDEAIGVARAGADLATGRFGRLVENLSDRLAKQIGAQSAAAQLRIVTETDPAKLLPLLNALERAASAPGGSAQRRQMVTSLRQMRAMNRPGVGLAVGAEAGRDR